MEKMRGNGATAMMVNLELRTDLVEGTFECVDTIELILSQYKFYDDKILPMTINLFVGYVYILQGNGKKVRNDK